jgi:hypothetical protein
MIKYDIITFGNYNWRVLKVEGDRALIISENIIELRWYNHEFVDITWAECGLRNYLNNEFYSKFSQDEQSKIFAVTNKNPDNPWFKTTGGYDTIDSIFLLSLEEVCEHFGSSTGSLVNKGSQNWLIDDRNNGERQAKFNNVYHWWRLRSPGYYSKTAASINSNGNVYVRGNGVYGRPRDGGGVRPALWLKLEEEIFHS